MFTLGCLKEKAQLLGIVVTSMRIGDNNPMIWFHDEKTGFHVKSVRSYEKANAWLDETLMLKDALHANK